MRNKIGIILYILIVILTLIINSLLINAIDKSNDVKIKKENSKVLPSY